MIEQKITPSKKDRVTVGVDLGGTNLRIAAFDSAWNRLAFINLPTSVSLGPEAVVRNMCDAIRSVLEQSGPKKELMGVGIGAPRPARIAFGQISPATQPARLQWLST